MTCLRALARPLLCVSLVFGVRSFGDAAVIGHMTLMRDPSIGIPFTSPDAALPDGWASYALTLSATGDDRIQAVEVNINGRLHQRWNDPDGGGVYFASGNSTNKSNGDSHLLGTPSMLFASGPTEDNPATGSPLSGENTDSTIAGVGANLAGTFGIPGAPVTYFELAYIVIPKSAESQILNIGVSALSSEGDILRQMNALDFLLNPGNPVGQVKGNSVAISNGDTTPRPEDNTDYGLGPIGVAEVRTFFLENISDVPLSLGVPNFTGPFSLASNFPNTLNPGGSASFNVRMTRDAPGNFLGSMSFMSNAGHYTFALAGQAVPEPTSAVLSLITLLVGCASQRRLSKSSRTPIYSLR